MKTLTIALAGLAAISWGLSAVSSYFFKREEEALKAQLEELKNNLISQRQIIAELTMENGNLLSAQDDTHSEIQELTSKLENCEQIYNNLQERFENMKNKLIIPREY